MPRLIRPRLIRKKPITRRKKWLYGGYVLLGLLVLTILAVNHKIISNAEGKLFKDVKNCPYVDVALVPGTSKTLPSGRENLFFTHRIEATAMLYHAGKIRHIIVSGDNSSKDYNEPLMMQEALIAKGIPADKIYLDYAGFDTWDSVERALRIFGQKKILIVSQRFQNERAIYIGESLGMSVLGFNAKDVQKYGGFLTLLREKFARLKVCWNAWSGRAGNFGGEKIVIDKE
jgi:SanA protein